MHCRKSLVIALAVALTVPASLAAQDVATAKAPKRFEFLRAEDFPADGILPAPPARGSEVEKLELAYLHALIADSSPQRREQAHWDDAHENPAIFDQAAGTDLEKLPATWSLLRAVQSDSALAATGAKVHFARIRPWGVDPTLPNCDAGKGNQPTNSYPSGHSTLGYSVGLMLATLMPTRARAILDRAADYALSRELCGVHFPSDTEASHVIAAMAVARILQNTAAASRIAAARAELAAFDK